MVFSAQSSSTVTKGSAGKQEVSQRNFGMIDHESGQLLNFASRVRGALIEIFGSKADEVESEICSALSIKDLETYIEKPTGFFCEPSQKIHIKPQKRPFVLAIVDFIGELHSMDVLPQPHQPDAVHRHQRLRGTQAQTRPR